MPTSVTNPELLVVIPYYNRPDTIKRAVDSVLAQTWDNFELLVVDDASDKPPIDVLGQDSRIRYFELRKNMGRYFIDAVASRANPYRYYMPHDSDDASEPERFERLVNRIEETDADVVYNLERKIELDGRDYVRSAEHFHAPIGAKMLYRTHHSGIYKTDSLRKTGGYHPGFRVSYDMFLMNSLIGTGQRVGIVEEPLYVRYRTEDSLTVAPAMGEHSLYRERVERELHQLYSDCLREPERVREIIEGSISPEHKAAMDAEIWRLRKELGWSATLLPTESAEAS